MNKKQQGISFSLLLLIVLLALVLRTFKEEGRIFPLKMPFQNPAVTVGPVVKEALKDNVQIPDSILNLELVKLILPRGDGDETEVGADFDGPKYGSTDRECNGQMFDGRTYVDLDEVESLLAFMTKELRSGLPIKDAPSGAYCIGAEESIIWVGTNQVDLLELKSDGTIERHIYKPSETE